MDLKELLQKNDVEKIKQLFSSSKPDFEVSTEEAMNQYNVDGHDVNDEDTRKDKLINKDTGEVNEEGEPITAPTMVPVARVAVPFQKLIVERRIGFMLTVPVKHDITSDEGSDQADKLRKKIKEIQDDNKMDYKNKEIARRLMSELEVAEIWYFVEADPEKTDAKLQLKMMILSPDQGDQLYPLFDLHGDMIAFARGYKVKVEGKDIEHFDVYIPEAEYKYKMTGNKYELDKDEPVNPIPNTVGKIMIIYYRQELPEWHDIQSMVDRLETLQSNHADMNDYFGSPILTIMGEVQGYAAKGEQGKILQLQQDAKANYLALGSEPKSLESEESRLENLIYGMSQTPDITFEKLKGIGNLSGVALELMFMDAHMAVKCKEEIYGIGLQRRDNLIKACIGKVLDTSLGEIAKKTQITPVLTPYLPSNITEAIDNLSVAVDSKLMSRETAIAQNPLVTDPETEMENIEYESAAEQPEPLQEVIPGEGAETGVEQTGDENQIQTK